MQPLQLLHLGLAVGLPLGLVLIVLADEPVRLLVCLLQHRVAELSVLLLQLVAGQVLHYSCTNGVSKDIGDGAESVPVNGKKEVRGEDKTKKKNRAKAEKRRKEKSRRTKVKQDEKVRRL